MLPSLEGNQSAHGRPAEIDIDWRGKLMEWVEKRGIALSRIQTGQAEAECLCRTL